MDYETPSYGSQIWDFLNSFVKKPGQAGVPSGTASRPKITAQPTVTPTVAPNLSPLGPPMSPTRRQVPGQGPTEIDFGQGWKPGDTPMLPPPPQYGSPPQMSYPGGADFSTARSWMDKAAPQAPVADDSYTSAILGGLAKGAGSVSSTEPGAFARTLAQMGAGGSAGREESLQKFTQRQDTFERQRQQHGENRANQEIQIAKMQHDYSVAKSQVDFQNAKLLFDTQFKNTELQYENNLKEMGLRAPKIQNVPGGFMVEQTTPDGKTVGKFYNTKEHWEKIEGIGKALGGLGLDTTTLQMNYILNSPDLSPPVKMSMLKEAAVKEIVNKGMGGAAFGKVYQTAQQQVDAELAKDQGYRMISASPTTAAKAIEMRNNHISSRVLQLLSQTNDLSWLKRAADFSRIGAVMTGREAPPE